MRSLKITLTLTALVAVFLLTVSGQKASNNTNEIIDTYENDNLQFELYAIDHNKKKKPTQNM